MTTKHTDTPDCFIRTLSTLTDQPCDRIAAELAAIADDTDAPADAPLVQHRYLLRHDWIRQKQPKKPDGKRCTVREWLSANPPIPMLLHLGRRTTCAINGRLTDADVPDSRTVTGLWVRRADADRLILRQDASSCLRTGTPFRSWKIWDKPAIRRVLEDCDRRTGLRSAELPIVFYSGSRSLGRLVYSNHSGASIHLNVDYFDSPVFPDEEAEDTIRHECAHYVDKMKFDKLGHGPTWKKACLMVGARPVRNYSEAIAETYRRQHLAEAAQCRNYDAFRPGMQIVHPRFGEGCIVQINGSGTHRNIDVEFSACGRKKLGIDWVSTHCRICAA